MKVNIELNMADPEERNEAEHLLAYNKYYCALHDVYNMLREAYKYSDYSGRDANEVVDELYTKFFSLIEGNDVDLHKG